MKQDKLLHYLSCILISIISTGIFVKIGLEYDRAMSIGTMIAFFVAIGKELYDKYVKKTKFDILDMIADIAGIFTALVIMLVYE